MKQKIPREDCHIFFLLKPLLSPFSIFLITFGYNQILHDISPPNKQTRRLELITGISGDPDLITGILK